jgi:hypothetical protein
MSRAGSITVAVLLLFGPRALAKPAASPGLALIGRVTATTRPAPPCGTGAFAMKVRFQVEQVVEGDYKQAFVDVIVGCPELFPVRLAVGAQARLVLAREQPRPRTSWAFMGELPAPRFPQFWLVEATQRDDAAPRNGQPATAPMLPPGDPGGAPAPRKRPK